MKLTSTELIGFLELVLGLLQRETKAFEGSALDRERLVTMLQGHLAAVLKANSDQEDLKEKAVESTLVATATQREAYVFASGALDMAIAAVGKDSLEAANYRRIRSRVRRPANGDPAEASAPVPADP